MFGSRGYRHIALLLAIFLASPAFSEDFEQGQNRTRIPIQVEFGDYMTSVQNKISKTWTPPDVLEEGHATVVFKIDKSGNLISTHIKDSSGNSLYDESAINSVKKASPYSEFPENATRETITIMYSFDSSIVSTDNIKELVHQSEKYVNRDNQMALNLLDKAIDLIKGDPSSYFLYARRSKINKLMGNVDEAKSDLDECKRLKIAYDKKRIAKCKEALMQDETPFAYFTLANAYELAGDYQNAIYNIDKAISMTELNNAYKRYKAEMLEKSGQK